MKKYILALCSLAILSACNDDFLEKRPIEKQTEENAFKTNENFKTFSWGFYETFTDNGNYTQGLMNNLGNYRGDMWAGYLSTYATTEPNPYRLGNMVTPTSGNGWNFDFIRRTNLMLKNIDGSNMNEVDKNHWRSVGYFFRAYRYMELVSRFGDVPWVTTVIKETETDLVYGKRDPRKTVTDNILTDLKYAEQNIKEGGDGANTINVHVVRAFMSRFCLFEGTWRKYHNLGDYEKFLNECVRVSELLDKKFPDVDPNYDNLLNSEDLSTYKGIILYKQYLADVQLHSIGGTERMSAGIYEMTKNGVETFLCQNGLPISNPNNNLYAGDKNMFDEFRNRDARLLLNVVPPYSMKKGLVGGMNPPSFEETKPVAYNANGYYNNPAINTEEYVDYMKVLCPNSTQKRLPVFNWSGTMNWNSPNILGPGQAPMASRSGYYMWKNYNLWEAISNMAALNTSDKPLFWIEEVLLNLAEAKFELGAFNQAVADQTINKLRPRAKVANMVVADIDAAFDTNRDNTVDPVLWEIRRERFAELIGHGFGFQDVRRWKKGEWYINQVQVGTYIKKSDYCKYTATGPDGKIIPAWNNLSVVTRDFKPATKEGYLKRFDNPKSSGKGWNDKYYLFAIPKNQLLLNPNLKPQNLGWDE